MSDLLLEVLSHHGQILKTDGVESVNLPTIMGPTTIMSNYCPYYGLVQIGILTYRKDGVERKIALGTHGIAEVYKNHVSVFVHTAEFAEDIDFERARKSREKALGLIEAGIEKTEGGLRAELALKKANIRLALMNKVQK